jgi:type I restriction enzyme R subunit
VIDVLRKGIKHGPTSVDLFYGAPSPGNAKAIQRFAANSFSVTRQLHYSNNETQLSIDLCLLINGMPIATFELKNSLTKQTVADAVQQYKRDRDPRELLFQFGRCVVHFAVDDQEVRFCTELKGHESWFLPFNKGYNDGAGNPPNPNGLKTDYLWKEVLTKSGLTEILENYAQIVIDTEERGRKKPRQIFPRYHQLSVVRKLLNDARQKGLGRRYLLEHSNGSGKSNSIAWLAYQLIGLKKESNTLFDSVIVVTDRRVLDKQIKDTVRQFAQVSSTVGHADHSGDLRKFLEDGKKIIITTVQKFPFVLEDIGNEHRGRKFAIIIDEAHSGQGGRAATKMNIALSEEGAETGEAESIEDVINRIMESRKMLSNASYFAFTATPRNKTLEIFGEAIQLDDKVKHRPFHTYSMKQAIEEGFILDVLRSFTPVKSYYRLMKRIEDDPEFDSAKAQRKLRWYVESNDYAVSEKTRIIVDHFHEQVIAKQKIGGKARAMIATRSIRLAVEYYLAVKAYLQERNSPYKAVVAFSGEPLYRGARVSEALLNGFPSAAIPDRVREDPYRFLIVAEKFQTGYDEPLLHTMYVDKPLSGIKAVQTLSRLNRAHPQKYDTFVLDFFNEADTIQSAFADYYKTTILSEETDPNRLHDLKRVLDDYQIYGPQHVEEFVTLYLGMADRDKLDPILDACVATYLADLDEQEKIDFKGKAKAYVRTYEFLASILPYSDPSWEKLAAFLNFLIPKLPAPMEEDPTRGLLEAIDIDSYRVEVQSASKITLPDETAEIGPESVKTGTALLEAKTDLLSNIIKTFNELFGNVDWKDADKIRQVIANEIPAKVAANKAYQNAMKNSDKQNARIEHDLALQDVVVDLLSDYTELYKQFSENPAFKKWLQNSSFDATYQQSQSGQ